MKCPKTFASNAPKGCEIPVQRARYITARAAACSMLCIPNSDEIRDVHWHLLDLRMVVPLDVLHRAHIVVRDEIDGHALSPETAAAADPVEVVLHVLRQVVV